MLEERFQESSVIGNPSDVKSVGNASAIFLAMLYMKEFTLGTNPLSVMSVEKLLLVIPH